MSPWNADLHPNKLVKIGEKTNVHLGKLQAKCKVHLVSFLGSFDCNSSIRHPKKAAVKNNVFCLEVEHSHVNPFARAGSNITQECLIDLHWTCTYLQTLSHMLYVSNHPFTEWSWGFNALLKTLQGAFDISFTNISYKLTGTQEDHIARSVHGM